jgi:hypothetical protein
MKVIALQSGGNINRMKKGTVFQMFLLFVKKIFISGINTEKNIEIFK